VKLDNNYK